MITLHCNDDPALTDWAVRTGVGRFVVASPAQCVAAAGRLEFLGVHHRLTPLLAEPAEPTVTSMVAGISCLRRRHGHIATRLSFEGLAPTSTSAVEDACARFRYPRPALVVQC